MSSEPLHPNDVCLYLSKASSDLADPQLYFLMKNVYKSQKTFDFLKQTDILDLFGSRVSMALLFTLGKSGLLS